MIIENSYLAEYGAERIFYETGDYIFREHQNPKYYIQILSGIVKMNNYDEEGREFIHGIYYDGDSLGEAVLLSGHAYPINCIALGQTTVFRMKRSQFMTLLAHFPETLMALSKHLAERLYYKYIILFNNSQNPSKKLMGLLRYFKTIHNVKGQFAYEIPLTRQQLADFTGLRVETVIRTLKKLHVEQEVRIKKGRIHV